MSDLTPAQVSHETGLSRSVIYRAIKAGDLPAWEYGKRLRVSRADLDDFKRRQRVRPHGPAYEPPAPSRRGLGGDSFGSTLKAIRGGKEAA